MTVNPQDNSTAQGRETRRWAALIYLAGDNDLSDAGLRDLQEICDARAATREGPMSRAPGGNSGADDRNQHTGVYVGVEIDTKGEHTGSIRYEISDEGHRTVIERLGEQDTGTPETLVNFLRWGFQRFPADHYLAVIWGHGDGFKLRRGIAYDDSGGVLDIPGVAQALDKAGLEAAPGRRLDILGFDACLMGMVEIAAALQDHAKILVGSQQTEPADGWPYDKVLQMLKYRQPASDAECGELGVDITRLYIDRWIKNRVPNVTQSAIDLGKIGGVMTALGELGTALAAMGDAGRDVVAKARTETQSFDMADYVDLLELCRALDAGFGQAGAFTRGAASAAARLVCVKATVAMKLLAEGPGRAILRSETYGPAVTRAHGLSVWFPTNPMIYHRYRTRYRSLAAVRCPKDRGEFVNPGEKCRTCGWEAERKPGLLDWVAFLDRYHHEGKGSSIELSTMAEEGKGWKVDRALPRSTSGRPSGGPARKAH